MMKHKLVSDLFWLMSKKKSIIEDIISMMNINDKILFKWPLTTR